MKAGIASIVFLLFFGQILFAQDRNVEQLEEVQLYSLFSPSSQIGSLTVLSDSLLNTHENLSSLLRKYANSYIKEQGRGMTASISIRGGSASQTAVYWNGIPINSSLNGQTDFNTIFSSSYNKISVRKGGGSVLLGSGAMSGAINLENEMRFENKTQGFVSSSLGSFQTLSSVIKVKNATKKMAIEVNYNAFTSKNKYSFYNSHINNENGEINQYAVQINAGYKINNNSKLYFKTQYNNSNRNTARTLFVPNNANLSYQTHLLVAGWKNTQSYYQSELKAAFVKENYTYTFDKKFPDNQSINGSKKWYSNYDIAFRLTEKIKIQTGLNSEIIYGEGTAIINSKRVQTALYTSWQHQLSNRINYHINLRKDWSSAFTIPVVFSIDSKQKWAKNHTTQLSFSTNYRVPTINDLYWENSGNIHLKPEQNWSTELAYNYDHQHKFSSFNKLETKVNITAFYSQNTDLIQWRPESNQFWKPINIQDVTSKGLEFSLQTNLRTQLISFFGKLQYSYTLSTDNHLNKQLIYMPKNKGGLFLNFSNKNWSLDVDQFYNGSVYTTSSNTTILEEYFLTNLHLNKTFKNHQFSVGFDLNNAFNTQYEIKKSRPMPLRNYTIHFNYKF